MKARLVVARNGGQVFVGLVLLLALYLTSLHSYLLFHSLIELFTVTVAAGVFVIAWNARDYLDNNYLVFVGIGSIFSALLDLFHTLAYEGMGVFASSNPDLATDLWIAARYVQGLTFLLAPIFITHRLRPYLTLAAFAGLTCFLFALIFYWQVFPATYVDGVGLTPFKKGSEYLVSLFFLGGIGLLLERRREFDPGVLHRMVAALLFLIASEVTFSFYLSVYGEANMLGHFLRLVGFYILYKAIIETGLDRPYALLLRDLNRSKDQLRKYATTLETRNGELRISERRLREDAALLRERNAELDAYAQTVAHDLKSPLSVIVAASELVTGMDDLPDETKRDLLEDIESTALHMSDIVDNLLMLSEVRKKSTPVEPVNMAAVVANVRNRLSHLIRQREARVTGPEQWPVARGYGPWIEEVWANYVSNAVKFGGNPPSVELGASAPGNGMLRFWVRDNGPGLEPEALADLFVPFTQLAKRGASGHGLGLSIALHIVEKLGGEVGVESEPGQGSRFFFTLPAWEPPGEAVLRSPAPTRSSGGNRVATEQDAPGADRPSSLPSTPAPGSAPDPPALPSGRGRAWPPRPPG